MITVRVGLAKAVGSLPAYARMCGFPVLVSANSFAAYKNGEFSHFRRAHNLSGIDAALDSAGFVAWSRYGGYPWSAEAYLDLVDVYPWTWYASMDACCEPQVARNREEVRRRQRFTLDMLVELNTRSERRGLQPPMPVIQGWDSQDYRDFILEALPLLNVPLVGIGSVCRRKVHGSDGLLRIVDAVDRCLPDGVKVHLFGVKSSALQLLKGHSRVLSTDSMAWEFAARVRARELGVSCSIELKAQEMVRWTMSQRSRLE